MDNFTTFTSRLAPLPIDNIDTDQIIPARFLKTISKVGLGDQLFYDWRYDAEGKPLPDFILNRTEGRAAQVLIAGDNFGCGSSREHAPWALTQYGFRAVISTSFADIFRGNALKNSLLPIIVPPEALKKLLAAVTENPSATVTIDLANQTLTLPDGSRAQFPIDQFAKHCMLEGVDELGYILKQEPAIAQYEAERELTVNTLA
ncbi:MAG: 3-isopropylmalate dehydratase small subunit [Acidobacteriaceae bacterium]|nr:3-isopropylmalate dehydratase small subunit [Acidobacteriaceae bacterium]MBV9503260.1 3-isopropylmalate dehydratase small subunit [Acidobacteriaceae bacterium]